jgi:uncharacterized protein (TIGR02145 family)
MIINRRFFVFLFILIGFIAMITYSCKKDEDITKRDPIITWTNPDDITVGTPLSAIQLNATADVEGTFVYTPVIGTVLSQGSNQNLKVDFTPSDAIKYNTTTKTITINVLAKGTMMDYDGNIYYTVKIGTQTWMVENLKVTHYRNGNPIANITDSATWTSLSSGAYCWYNNDIANKTTYGALYNWFTVNDSRKIAPSGWHVPTYADWIILNQYLGGYEVAGGKMKESGLVHWAEPNAGADNSSGFTALPSGLRSWDGTYYNLFYTCTFWSATENADDVSRAWRNGIYYIYPNSLPGDDLKQYGYSIRCIKD